MQAFPLLCMVGKFSMLAGLNVDGTRHSCQHNLYAPSLSLDVQVLFAAMTLVFTLVCMLLVAASVFYELEKNYVSANVTQSSAVHMHAYCRYKHMHAQH